VEFVLGIDLGTSYFKLGLFDRMGKLCGLGRVFVPKQIGNGNLCELEINDFWSLLQKALAQACRQGKASTTDIKAVAYASQANSFLLLDGQDKPLTPLVLWPDNRVQQVDSSLLELSQGEDFLEKTGLGIDISAQFCLAKLLWFQQYQPEIWSQVARIMTISDYLTFSLTNKMVGDMGTASLLGLLDLQQRQWWQKALDTLQLTSSQLSTPLLPGSLAGKICSNTDKYLGLPTGIPFVIGSLDHHLAAVGAGIGSISHTSDSSGTVLACLRYRDDYESKKDCCMGPHIFGEGYYQLAFDNFGAGMIDWYQQNHTPDLSLVELTKKAALVPVGCDKLIAAETINQYERLDGFKHRSSCHQHGHFIRAIMEAAALKLSMLIDHLWGDKIPSRIVSTGGGAKNDLWLQIKADMLNVEFMVTDCTEPACRGAAMIAALAAGWFKNLGGVSDAWISVKKKYHPDHQTHQDYRRWQSDLGCRIEGPFKPKN
jgi:xylulokinase